MNYYNENDRHAAQWLRELIKEKLIPNGFVDDQSICDVQAADLAGYTQCHFFAGIGGWSYALQLSGWPESEPVWTGSCPCQPFSVAGAGKGTADARHLWPEFKRLIESGKPATVFGEQVASKAGREWLAGVFADLEGMGYQRAGADLCAAGVAAPHIRQRIWWVANIECERFQESRQCWKDSSNNATDAFRETNRLVNAVRWKSLPFLCSIHDGISESVGRVAVRGMGNAIVPQVAAEFIQAFLEARQSNVRLTLDGTQPESLQSAQQ